MFQIRLKVSNQEQIQPNRCSGDLYTYHLYGVVLFNLFSFHAGLLSNIYDAEVPLLRGIEHPTAKAGNTFNAI